MANIKDWLLEAEKATGETIEAIVVGKHYDAGYSSPSLPDENIILDRETGLAKLDQEYGNGYGGADCFPMYAWMQSRIYLIHEYDGATGPVWIPRHPVSLEPEFGGQSA